MRLRPVLVAAAVSAVALPAFAQGHDWAMRITDTERTRSAILAYEVPDTDDQPFNLSCEEGGRGVFPSITGGPADLTRITLSAGDQTRILPGQTTPTEMEDMPRFVAEELAVDDPVFEAFMRSGAMTLAYGDQTLTMTASAVGHEAVGDFFHFCG